MIILTILSFGLCIWALINAKHLDEFILFPILLFAICFLATILISNNHTNDLATVRTSEDIIKVHQEAIEEVDRQLKEFPVLEPSLMNSDSPYRSLIELRGERIKAISECKIHINRAKRNIIARKLGISSRDIVWLLGDK